MLGILIAPLFFNGAAIWVTATAIFAVALLQFLKLSSKSRITCVLLSLAIGFVWLRIFSAIFLFNADFLDGEHLAVRGKITDITPYESGYAKYELKIEKTNQFPATRAVLYAKGNSDLRENDIISAAAQCESANKNDRAAYYKSEGVSMLLTAYEPPALVEKGRLPISSALAKSAESKLSEESGAMLSAMLFGKKDNLSAELAYNSTRSGIRHIFVVSGMHITIISGALLSLLRKLRLKRQIANSLALVGVWAAVLFTGAGIPSVRAGIMMSCLLIGGLFFKKSDSLNSLMISAIIICFMNPFAITSASFLLTFSSTCGVVLFSRKLKDWLTKRIKTENRIIQSVLGTLSVTLAANVGMFPATLLIFKGVSLAAPITNILILPVMTAVLLLGLLLTVFGEIYGLGSAVSFVLEWLLTGIRWVSGLIAEFRYSYLGLNYDYVRLWAILSAAFLILVFVIMKSRKEVLRAVPCCFAALLISFCVYSLYNRSDITIKVLGDDEIKSVAVRYRGVSVGIILEGGDYAAKDIGEYFQSVNIDNISCLADLEGKSDKPIMRRTAEFEKEPKDGQYSIGGEYLIFEDKNFSFKLKDGAAIINSKGESAVITNDISAIISNKYDYVFLFSEYDKKIKIFSKDCVILLKRPALERNAIADQFINGYSNEPEFIL